MTVKDMRKNRIWEIDLLRGIAFLCMVYDHAIYDVNHIFGYGTNFLWGYDDIIGDTSAIIFMVLCGISVNLSRAPFRNGLKVFGVASCLTVVTGLVDKYFSLGVTINFGILHLLGIAIMVGAAIKRLHPAAILPIAIFCILFRRMLTHFFTVNKFYWLFPFGFTASGFYSSDYYPIFPYIGIVFVGIFLGKILYKEKRSLFPFSLSGKDPLSFIGRNSLFFYVIHQPILLAIVYAGIWLLENLNMI